jgi:hypothetical protein
MLMSDSNMGEMFLNFPLHPNIIHLIAIDLDPLEYGDEQCVHRWMCWHCNLMGFKSSLYNSICTYLVPEEIIRGDWHDRANAFQWEYAMINLMGSS